MHRLFLGQTPSLSTRVIAHAVQWVYGRHEVIVFRAAPWDEAENSDVDAEVILVKQGVGDGNLPPLAPDVARALRRRIAWRSRSNDVCYLLVVDGRGVGYGWIRSAGKIEIDEIGLSLVLDSSQICFFDFYIDPSVRRRGLYTKLLRELRRRYRTCSALIYAEGWNVASRTGVSAAGFTPVASVHGSSVFGKRFPTAVHVSPSLDSETRKAEKHENRAHLSIDVSHQRIE